LVRLLGETVELSKPTKLRVVKFYGTTKKSIFINIDDGQGLPLVCGLMIETQLHLFTNGFIIVLLFRYQSQQERKQEESTQVSTPR
jgi:hypothetical protein